MSSTIFRTRTRFTRTVVVALLAFGAAGCDQSLLAPAPSQDASMAQEESLFLEENLADALDALEAKVGAKPQALELELRADRMKLQVLGKTPDTVVEYRYRDDRWAGPESVTLSGSGELSRNLFPLELATLRSIPALVREAVTDVDEEHGSARRVLLRRNLPESNDVRFRVYVDSPIRSGQFDADENAKPIEGS